MHRACDGTRHADSDHHRSDFDHDKNHQPQHQEENQQTLKHIGAGIEDHA